MKNNTTAGLLALFLGWLGVHRFYLNQTGLGILYLILGAASCFVIPLLISLVDAFVLLIMGTAEFNQKYNMEYVGREVNVHVHSYTKEQTVIPPKAVKKMPEAQIESMAPKAKNKPKVTAKVNRKTTPAKKQNINNPHKTTGIAKFKQYDFKGAKDSFKKALAIHYDDIATHFNLACCYSMEEDIDKSLFHLSKAVELGFKDFKRIHKHDALAFLRSHDEFLEFAKNDYQWKTETEKETPKTDDQPKALSAPPVDILDELEQIDELDLNAPTKEKVILTEEVTPKEQEMSYEGTDDIFDDLFGAQEDETGPIPIQPQGSILSDEILEKLQQLGNLRDKGILTEEEFNEQKKRLLG